MGLSETLYYYWYEQADLRTKDWLLIDSPYIVPFIIFSYLYFILKCGPDFMKNRPPYSLKTFIKYYNIFEIVANAWVVYAYIDAGWFTEVSLYCEPVKYTYDYSPYQLAVVSWWVTLLKLFDFVETGIFVLRKKNKQITFLHIYHHISTVLILWVSMRYIAGGMSTFIILVNSMVHVIMYTYYYMSTYGPEVQKFLNPYKHLITIIQMVQFVGLIIYLIQALMPSCPVPKYPAVIMLVNLSANFLLFYNFYRKAYKVSAKKGH